MKNHSSTTGGRVARVAAAVMYPQRICFSVMNLEMPTGRGHRDPASEDVGGPELEPAILHERANQGRTTVEHFEESDGILPPNRHTL